MLTVLREIPHTTVDKLKQYATTSTWCQCLDYKERKGSYVCPLTGNPICKHIHFYNQLRPVWDTLQRMYLDSNFPSAEEETLWSFYKEYLTVSVREIKVLSVEVIGGYSYVTYRTPKYTAKDKFAKAASFSWNIRGLILPYFRRYYSSYKITYADMFRYNGVML